MRIATVYSCMKLLSDSVASLPLSVEAFRRGVFTEDSSHLAYLLSVQPNEDMSAFDFWSQAVQYQALHGNAYVIPVRSPLNGEIERFLLPHPDCVTYESMSGVYFVADTQSGFTGTLTSDRIIHIRNTSHDGLNGVGLITWARQILSTTATGDEETLKRFANGGNVRGIVSNETDPIVGFGHYADDEIDKVAVASDALLHTGRNIISMPGRVKFDQFSSTSADMQFLETRKFSVREICRFFRVPPSFVFDDTSNNYKSAENALLDFRQNALNPLLCRIEGELTRKLIGESGWKKRRIRFDRSALSACDTDAQMKYAGARIQNGIDTINEARLANNKPPVEGGDTVIVSANLKTIKQLIEEQDNNGKSNQAPHPDGE